MGLDAGDAPALQDGFAALSKSPRALRFLRPQVELSAAEVHLFTRPYHDAREAHEAIGALDIRLGPPRPAGVAR